MIENDDEMYDIVLLCYATCTGEVGRMYEAHVDDVGYRLVAIYTPVREDGVEGAPVSASTEPIAVGMHKILPRLKSFFLFALL